MKPYKKSEETAQRSQVKRPEQEHRRQRRSTLSLLATLETLGNHVNALEFPKLSGAEVQVLFCFVLFPILKNNIVY